MFDKLEKHHIGYIIPKEEKGKIEERIGKKFHFDAIQQTHVLFDYDDFLRIYTEYICQEGRVARQKTGFAHICYNVNSSSELEDIERSIREHKMGYPLTELEKSGSAECGYIKFYFIKNHGVIELNLRSEN